MPFVEEAVEFRATEAELDSELAAEHGRYLPQRPDGHVLEPPDLDQRHEVLADARALADVSLAKTAAMAEGSCAAAVADVVHSASMAEAACVARTRAIHRYRPSMPDVSWRHVPR